METKQHSAVTGSAAAAAATATESARAAAQSRRNEESRRNGGTPLRMLPGGKIVGAFLPFARRVWELVLRFGGNRDVVKQT